MLVSWRIYILLIIYFSVVLPWRYPNASDPSTPMWQSKWLQMSLARKKMKMLSPHCPHDFSIPMFSVTHTASLDLSSKMYPFPSWCPYLFPFLISILLPSDLWSQYSHLFAWLTHHTWLLSKDIRILLGFSKFNKAIIFMRLLCNNFLLSLRAAGVSTQNHQAPCCRVNQHSWLDFLSRYILFSFFHTYLPYFI